MIYLIGANATGKSSMTGWILNNFKNSQAVGIYKKRQIQGTYTGGADALKITNQKRRDMLQNIWMSDKDIVIMEGMIIISKLNIDYFLQLQKKFYRKIIVIHLFCSLDTLQKRIYERSKGKVQSEKRTKNLIDKTKISEKVAKYAESLRLKDLHIYCDDINAYNILKQKLKKQLE